MAWRRSWRANPARCAWRESLRPARLLGEESPMTERRSSERAPTSAPDDSSAWRGVRRRSASSVAASDNSPPPESEPRERTVNGAWSDQAFAWDDALSRDYAISIPGEGRASRILPEDQDEDSED